jgi:transposase
MIALPSSVRILLWREPVDLRRGFDGLAALVGSVGEDVYSGHLFCFASKRRNRVKILMWQRGGFLMVYKRLSQGCFQLPRAEVLVIAPPRRKVIVGPAARI